jgi:hypothetical protein
MCLPCIPACSLRCVVVILQTSQSYISHSSTPEVTLRQVITLLLRSFTLPSCCTFCHHLFTFCLCMVNASSFPVLVTKLWVYIVHRRLPRRINKGTLQSRVVGRVGRRSRPLPGAVGAQYVSPHPSDGSSKYAWSDRSLAPKTIGNKVKRRIIVENN